MKDWEPIELKITFEKLEQIIRADERERWHALLPSVNEAVRADERERIAQALTERGFTDAAREVLSA